MSSPPGAIEGKYEVIAKMREGGMGAVYLVRHRLLNELRVIKVMRPEVAESAEQRKRFLREAQTATRLKHSNIVGFYDFFVDDEGTAYMVMEYIDGLNLRDMFRNCGPLPITLGLYLARQCLSALDYLHRKGIVHRDVSPDNIMMTQEEDGALHAKLIDLGIAKLARAEEQEQLTAADEFIGKLRYSSPEQLTKKATSAQIDGRSDIFSFGVVLYECLTGISPYGGGSLQEILTARLQKPPMSFEKSDPNGRVSEPLRRIIERALQRKPEDRYQSSQEFSKALEALPPAQSAPETPEEVQRYVRSAVEIAMKAAAAQNPAGMSLQRTLQSKFRVSEISLRPLEATDMPVQKALARWTDATPTRTVEGSDPSRQTHEATLAHGASRAAVGVPAAEARKPSPVIGYVLAAAGAALLVVIGVVVSGLVSGKKGSSTDATPRALPTPATQTSASTQTALPPPSTSTGTGSTSTATSTSASTQTETLSTTRVVEVPPTRPPKREATRAPRREEATPVRIAQVVSPANPNRPKMHFCAEISKTGYFQGVVKEVPQGFKDLAALEVSPDAARIKINITVAPEEPLEGREFIVVAKFVNGGDGTFRMARAEESAGSARGGYQPIAGFTPTPVDEASAVEIFRTTRVLNPGETYRKSFRVVEQRRGDAWEASVTVKPCVEQ